MAFRKKADARVPAAPQARLSGDFRRRPSPNFLVHNTFGASATRHKYRYRYVYTTPIYGA